VVHSFAVEIPTLALDMMGVKSVMLKTFKNFVPPSAPAAEVEGNRIQIPANSAIIITL
jgi:hypothetical protein